MYRLTSKLVIYRNMGEDSILFRLADICQRFAAGNYVKENLITDIYVEIHRLLDISTRYGFDKNLWHNYLAFILAMSENPFTMVSEKVGANQGTVNEFAKSDFKIFKQLFDYDFSAMEKELEINCFSVVTNYKAVVKSEQIFNRSVSEKVQELSDAIAQAADESALYDIITGFYQKYGVGKFGLNKAFRITEDEEYGILSPITTTGDMTLDDLVGYEEQKKKLMENTEAFVRGRKANNCLLFGDAGTGKSSSIKGILNRYYDEGLRIIEVYKHQFKDLPKIISQIKSRNYKFIIYMDDLSFEEFEIEYKYLKAVIEGGLETKPDNVLIYATSNRRHLIKESFDDVKDYKPELHSSDTVQEKLSLVARFGVTIYYGAPEKQEYDDIVINLAKKNGIEMDTDELLLEAGRWELNHGGRSGRCAQQFIIYLLGQKALKK